MRRRTTCALIATTAAFVLMGARCGGNDEANPGAVGERSGEEIDSEAQMDTAPMGEESVPDDSTNTESEDGAAPTTTTP